MKAPYLIPLLAAGFVLVGCSEQPTGPDHPDPFATSSFDFSSQPEIPGQSHRQPRVQRAIATPQGDH